MIIASVSRRRGLSTGPGATGSVAGVHRAAGGLPFRVAGGFPCAAVAGVASATATVPEAPAASRVFPEAWPVIVGPIASAERPILERFLSDLAAAPELAGELVALYVEQHPTLALRFVMIALQSDLAARAAIMRAARRRQRAGLDGLALVLLAALALAATPEPELDAPPLILDVDDETSGDDRAG